MQYNQILFYHAPWLMDLNLFISSTAAHTHTHSVRTCWHTPTITIHTDLAGTRQLDSCTLPPVQALRPHLWSLPFQTMCFCASPHQWWLPHVLHPPASYSTCPPHGPPVCSALQPIHGTAWCPAPRNSWCECFPSDNPLTLMATP